MESALEQLHYFFVEKPHLDAFPGETREFAPLLEALPQEQADAYERLRNNASITGFQAGFKLGLALGLEVPPAP